MTSLTKKVNILTSLTGHRMEAAMSSSIENPVSAEALQREIQRLRESIAKAHKCLELGRPTQAQGVLEKAMEKPE